MDIGAALRKLQERLGLSGSARRPAPPPRGERILVDESEKVIGNEEAAAFLQSLVGGSLRTALRGADATNVPDPTTFDPNAVAVGPTAARRMRAFREFGVLLEQTGSVHIFAKPGSYPHVDLERAQQADEEDPSDGRPLVISSRQVDNPPLHATVVFTVLHQDRPTTRKTLTVHFHGGAVIRAKGVVRETGGYTRPSHYDGQEVRQLLEQRNRKLARQVHWCSPLERF